MDGAGTIFDRIEEKLSALGVNADIGGLQKASAEYDARVAGNPEDLDSKIIGLELKVVMLGRLLNATVEVLEARGGIAHVEAAPEAAAAPVTIVTPAKKVKRLRQNPATGIIEEVEDAEDNVIVADSRGRFRGNPAKEGKRSVFIQATDDEAVAVEEKAKK